MVVVDGARFLPACTTISRVVVSLWSSSGTLLAGPFEGVSLPGSDARSPMYMCKATLDAAQSSSSFDDPTATLLFQVRCHCSGYVACAMNPKKGGDRSFSCSHLCLHAVVNLLGSCS